MYYIIDNYIYNKIYCIYVLYIYVNKNTEFTAANNKSHNRLVIWILFNNHKQN